LGSVPAPWLLVAAGAFLSVTSTLAVTAVGISPTGAVSLAALPTLAGIAGAMVIGADIRFGPLHTELLLAGRRAAYWLRLNVAIAVAAACLALTSTSTALLVAAAVGQPLPRPAGLMVACVGVAVVWAVVAASLTMVTGSQAGAIGALLGYLFLVEPMAEAGFGAFGAHLPARVSAQLLAARPSVTWVDVLGLAGCALVAGSVAALILDRRDVSVTRA
jgi:hypothetical protein